MLEEPAEGAVASSRFDYDAMLEAETKGKEPEKSQPKRGADGHLTFDTDGALTLSRFLPQGVREYAATQPCLLHSEERSCVSAIVFNSLY